MTNTNTLAPQHFLTGTELTQTAMLLLLNRAMTLKQTRQQQQTRHLLLGKQLALLFDKPSLRTRFSFTVAMHECGGNVIESVSNTRKTETPADQARVLGGYCHAIMVRTHHDSDLAQMAAISTVPIINGLSDLHHPCQILADLLTLFELFGTLQGLTVCYIGDGNNVLHSLLLLAPQMGINLHYCCPATRAPNPQILASSQERITHATAYIQQFTTPEAAVTNADAVYTDVWASMGFEGTTPEHLFAGFQVNESLMQHALPHAIFMHCLPMERGKEVSASLPDQPCSVVFRQSENRLHVQKALLLYLLTEKY